MTTSPNNAGERVKDVRCDEDSLIVDLADGRTISVPLAWYPRLLGASAAHRDNWIIGGGGFGIHWPDIDEDLSTEGLLRGLPAPSGQSAGQIAFACGLPSAQFTHTFAADGKAFP